MPRKYRSISPAALAREQAEAEARGAERAQKAAALAERNEQIRKRVAADPSMEERLLLASRYRIRPEQVIRIAKGWK